MCAKGITKILQNKFEISSCCFNVFEICLKIYLPQKFSIVNSKCLAESIPIVGISLTLVVGGELNQHKSGGSLSPHGLAFGV